MTAEIYHLVPLAEWNSGRRDGAYTPARLDEDGFVHCSPTPESVLAVARDCFADLAEPLLVLRIDPDRLQARLVYEAPAPIAGSGTSHLEAGALFPHVYGSLNLDAITGVGQLARRGAEFVWPKRWIR